MTSRLRRLADVRFTATGLGKALLIQEIPTTLAAIVAVALAPAVDPSAPKPYDYDAGWLILGLVIFAPAVETFMLIYPTVLVKDASKRHWLGCLLGSAPVALVHTFQLPHKPLVVWWAFAWQAHCYLTLHRQGVDFWRRCAFVFALHAAGNGILVALLLLARSFTDSA